MNTAFEDPPRRHNADGDLRRVGVEIEFAGVPLRTVGDMIVDLYGGAHWNNARVSAGPSNWRPRASASGPT